MCVASRFKLRPLIPARTIRLIAFWIDEATRPSIRLIKTYSRFWPLVLTSPCYPPQTTRCKGNRKKTPKKTCTILDDKLYGPHIGTWPPVQHIFVKELLHLGCVCVRACLIGALPRWAPLLTCHCWLSAARLLLKNTNSSPVGGKKGVKKKKRERDHNPKTHTHTTESGHSRTLRK